MSCRVLKRGMEDAMLDALVKECGRRNVKNIYGYYYPTAKNSMVKEFYGTQGFQKISGDAASRDGTVWVLDLESPYTERNRCIRVED